MKKHISVFILLAVLAVVFNTGCGTKVKVGDIITFGHYEQDNNTSNGKEPINWRVLDIDSNGHLFIISDKVLDKQQYNTTKIPITWEKSTIRSWLNGYGSSYNTVGTDYTNNNFIDTAFTPKEKARIITSTVPAHANPYTSSGVPAGQDFCNATSDKIFLLSVVEAEKYFKPLVAINAHTTLYATNNGVSSFNWGLTEFCNVNNFQTNNCKPYWWLRSPSCNVKDSCKSSIEAATVAPSHKPIGSASVTDGIWGVRPALWVNY